MFESQILQELEAEREEVESLLLTLSAEIRTAAESWQAKHSLRVRLSRHLFRVEKQIATLQQPRRAMAA